MNTSQTRSTSSLFRHESPHYLTIRFQGPFAEVEPELERAQAAGHNDWCALFRDLHHDNMFHQAPHEFLNMFAEGAPSDVLQGYVLGILVYRESAKASLLPDWIDRVGQTTNPVIRGVLLGNAFMFIGWRPSTGRFVRTAAS